MGEQRENGGMGEERAERGNFLSPLAHSFHFRPSICVVKQQKMDKTPTERLIPTQSTFRKCDSLLRV